MSYTKEQLEEMIAEMIPLIAQHKVNGKISTAETCEKIEMPYEEWADID